MRFHSLGHLLESTPCELGVTEWEHVSQLDVMAFAGATRAREWIHTDPVRAAEEGPFGGPVVHGFLTLALATHFQTQLLELPPNLVGINYGINKARFPSPVPVGSRVRSSGRLAGAEALDGGAQLAVVLTYERDGDNKPPCVVEVVSRVVPVTP